jgi:GntR family transcriptional regulator
MVRERPWRQIAADLRRAIDIGEYCPGDRLPTGAELMDRYGVARQTVQNAVEQLRSEGLITSTPGGRVYIRARSPIQRLARSRLSRAERAAGRGAFLTDASTGAWNPQVTVELRHESADADVAAELGIATGDEVFVRDRVMRTDETPVQLATSYLPRVVTRGTPIERENTGPGGIYARLEEAGHQLTHFVERVRTTAPTDAEAAALGIGRGVTILRIARVAFSGDQAVELNRIVALGERFELVYELPAN